MKRSCLLIRPTLVCTLGIASLGAFAARERLDPIERVERRTVFQVEPLPVPLRGDPSVMLSADSIPGPLALAAEAIDAMRTGDFDRWLTTWDEGGQEYYSERAKADYGQFPRRNVAEWQRIWRSLFGGNEVTIVAWIRTPTFAVVCYEIRRPDATLPPGSPGLDAQFDSDGVLRSRMAFAEVDGRWLQTGRFAAHPVFQGWRTASGGVVVAATVAEWSEEQAWPPPKR